MTERFATNTALPRRRVDPPMPPGSFQEIAVLAFPAPTGDGDTIARHVPKITGSTPKPLTYEVAQPFTARSLTVFPVKETFVTLRVAGLGRRAAIPHLRKFEIDRHNLSVGVGPVPLAPVSVSVPATTARFFRLVFPRPASSARSGSPRRSASRVTWRSNWPRCSNPAAAFRLLHLADEGGGCGPTWPSRPEAVQDIRGKMAADGTLTLGRARRANGSSCGPGDDANRHVATRPRRRKRPGWKWTR